MLKILTLAEIIDAVPSPVTLNIFGNGGVAWLGCYGCNPGVHRFRGGWSMYWLGSDCALVGDTVVLFSLCVGLFSCFIRASELLFSWFSVISKNADIDHPPRVTTGASNSPFIHGLWEVTTASVFYWKTRRSELKLHSGDRKQMRLEKVPFHLASAQGRREFAIPSTNKPTQNTAHSKSYRLGGCGEEHCRCSNYKLGANKRDLPLFIFLFLFVFICIPNHPAVVNVDTKM